MRDFECLDCGEDFTAEWNIGDEVECTHCKIRFETDFDEDWDGIQGVWLTKAIGQGQ